MPRGYSAKATTELNRLHSTDSPILLLEITEPTLSTPLRAAQGNDDILHLGNTFQALQFDAALPDDLDQSEPRAQLQLSNIGRDLVKWLEDAGGAADAEARFIQVLPSDPDTIEYEVTMDLSNVQISPLAVQGELSFDTLVNQPGVSIRHTPETSPGLF